MGKQFFGHSDATVLFAGAIGLALGATGGFFGGRHIGRREGAAAAVENLRGNPLAAARLLDAGVQQHNRAGLAVAVAEANETHAAHRAAALAMSAGYPLQDLPAGLRPQVQVVIASGSETPTEEIHA